MRKIFIFVACLVLTTAWLAFAQAEDAQNSVTLEAPTAPTFTCGSPTTNPNYYHCYNNVYSPALREYQTKLDGYNRARATSGGGTFQVSQSGTVNTPAAPVNNCGTEPTAATTQHSTWLACKATYNQNMHNYQQSMDIYNNLNSTFQNSDFRNAQAQAQDEERRLAQLNQNNSAAGTLNEAQSKSRAGKQQFAMLGSMLAVYGAYKAATSAYNAGVCASCTGFCVGPCVQAVVYGAAAVVLYKYATKADDQSARLGHMEAAICDKQNQLTSQQQNCNMISQSAQQYDPNNPNYSNDMSNWIDPSTGQCRTGAPATCQQRMTEARASGMSMPKLQAECAGGGTACMANGFKPIVTDTPKGKKYTMKSKDGKEFSIYESDLTDVKGLMASGLSAKDAKAFADEMSGIVETAAKKEAAAKKGSDDASLVGLNGLDSKIGSFGSGFTDPNAAVGAEGGKVYKDDLKAVTDKDRKPTSEGLSKDFHGDLIGSAGDSIFLMMNRRYQLKNEQDTFISPE